VIDAGVLGRIDAVERAGQHLRELPDNAVAHERVAAALRGVDLVGQFAVCAVLEVRMRQIDMQKIARCIGVIFSRRGRRRDLHHAALERPGMQRAPVRCEPQWRRGAQRNRDQVVAIRAAGSAVRRSRRDPAAEQQRRCVASSRVFRKVALDATPVSLVEHCIARASGGHGGVWLDIGMTIRSTAVGCRCEHGEDLV